MNTQDPICTICKTHTRDIVKVTKGQIYTDQDGKKKRSKGLSYHYECRNMQNKGLLNTHNS